MAWRDATTASEPIRTAAGAVLVPLPWSVAPPLAPRLRLPEVLLARKDELHLTLLSSAEAEALDARIGRRDAWRDLAGPDSAFRPRLRADWWLLRAEKPEGLAHAVVARARCPAFEAFRRRAAAVAPAAIAADAPAHVTLYVAGDPRGIGLPSRARFEACRIRRLSVAERRAARRSPEDP